ncbi:MAG: hypothetical protein AAGF11_55065 [Myxococcota bacterium]
MTTQPDSHGALSGALDVWPVCFDDEHRWQVGPNQARIAILSPHVIGFELVGSLEANAFGVIEPCLARFLDRCPDTAHLFWDCERLDRHDSTSRDGLVTLLRTYRTRWKLAHVLYRSPLIGVTVSAVNLAVGGSVNGYRRREEFRAAVEDALANP